MRKAQNVKKRFKQKGRTSPLSKPKRARRHLRRATTSHSESTTAIVHVEQPQALAASSVRSMVSMVRKVQDTVEDLERVRRFVSTCLNLDLQKWEKKNPFPLNGTPDIKKDWEEERKSLEVDWGTIPGDDKPFLMQPGAEKFMFWLELRPKYMNHEMEMGDGHLEIVSHVVFFHKRTNEEVFEGPDCSCTTMETNYRFVWGEKPNPCPCSAKCECGYKDRLRAVKMGRNRLVAEWKRRQKVGERWIWEERLDNPNIYGERNKVRQIGQKRALVKGVRNMGAISEIFRQPPDEWDIPEECEDTPETDADYTAGGRPVYVNGKSPSGRHTDPQDRRQQEQSEAAEALKAKGAAYWCAHCQCPLSEKHYKSCEFARNALQAEQNGKKPDGTPLDAAPRPSSTTPQSPSAPAEPPNRSAGDSLPQYVGKISVDCTNPADPIVRGDLDRWTEGLEKHCQAVFRDGWWRIPPGHVETIREMCKQTNYEFEKLDPIKKSAPVKKSASRSAKKATPGEHVVEGIIEKAITKQGARPRIDFLVKTEHGDFWMSCWSKTWFTILAQEPFPKPVTLLVETRITERGTYRNIKRATKIRGKAYDEDGKPEIQMRDREAGGQTLFP